MAFHYRGTGTLDYGKRDFQPNGSYVTTLWVVFLYLPIFPVCSKRIGPTGEVKYYSMKPVRTFHLYEKTKPSTKQVLSVYAWFAVELLLFLAGAINQSKPILAVAVLFAALPWLLRKRATDRMKDQTQRRAMGFSDSVE